MRVRTYVRALAVLRVLFANRMLLGGEMPLVGLWSANISSAHLWATPSRTATIGMENNPDLRGVLSRGCHVHACCTTAYSSCACYCRFWVMACGMCAFVFARPQPLLRKTSFYVSSLPSIRNAKSSPDVRPPPLGWSMSIGNIVRPGKAGQRELEVAMPS
jgi:hypothetical protein